ncbi:MAG: hydantoinase B/oxoprolinase family protein, partial [Novosphingobium sp.]|nr:hydantoinase B/oxoprolinase family protein [Novosphingobium sp.]
ELGESEVYAVPCKLTVVGGTLHFDFAGCPPQLPRYLNSKPYIVQSALASVLQSWIAADLPYSQALIDLMDVDCPPKSMLNCEPPAPIGAAHMDGTGAAITAAMQCLLLALAASPDAPEHRLLSAPPSNGWAMMTWAFQRDGGDMDSFIHTDGTLGGSPAGVDRDGIDLSSSLIGTKGSLEMPDVEILEASYPILMEERGSSRGKHGLGAFRSGGACREVLRPHGTEKLTGYMISTRGTVPNQGAAGGELGMTTLLRWRRADGSGEDIPLQAAGVEVAAGESFELQGPTAGGFGDPLARPLDLVADDVREGRITPEEARSFYALVLAGDGVDAAASEALRCDRQAARLARANPPEKPGFGDAPSSAQGVPLYPGVVQVGSLALSEYSGAVLARSPDCWTQGCCTLDEQDTRPSGYVVRTRAFLDPRSGRQLFKDILAEDGASLFESSPSRWTGEAGVA